ncbi:hypothetical protein TWF192_006877 [Orbilia oligospora]|uniref:methionine--tRNA ligase n=1 Tax=Orbilia oligospora TaxID=2813651 RepID=A0A6G1M784_ORBOL|nr:hypothetical protein TWF191_008970 [Orbilia oligospora]KAF3246363.1 hypothetical protein TWF192_006877 [Orbilia oligospora]
MATSLKLNIPTVAPRGSPAFAQALKACCAITAFQADQVQFCKSTDAAVSLEAPKEGVTIVDINAIVRYLARVGGVGFKAERAPDDAWIEWEELVLRPRISELSTVLDLAEQLLVKSGIVGTAAAISPAQIILFSTLYDSTAGASPSILDKHPQLKTWFRKTLDSEWAIEGIQKAAAMTTVAPTDNSSAKAVKGAAGTAPKVEKKPVVVGTVADRKLGDGIEMKVYKDGEKILPVPGQRNVLITSALPYVNNVPHLGNIIGSVLSADVYSRYCKARNYNCLYVCGTDEYGTATETKALEEKVTPRELCDKYNALHQAVYKWFNIGFDHFGRTTTAEQTEIAQDIFLKLHKNGYLSEDSITQLYCEQHDGFLADRYVEGTCPKCNYDDARGDQCDKCGTLLDPMELIKPRCKLDNATPVVRPTKHIYLELGKLQPQEEAWFNKSVVEGAWARNGKMITESWLKEGLQKRAITRDLSWGTPLPKEGFEDYQKKVLYVWFDACIGYVSITATYTPEWEKWWKDPENVRLYQFMGKDNVPFHSVIFPSSQLGTGDKWTMVHHISTTEYLQYEGGKFSKSRNVGVFGNNAEDTGVPADVWRFYLLASRPETGDTQFIWRDFIYKNNSELLARFGNFVNRLVKFAIAKYEGLVPDYTTAGNDPSFDSFKADINKLLKEYVEELETVHIRAGTELLMQVAQRGNQFLQDNKLDNATFAVEPAKTAAVVGLGLNLIYLLSALSYPYMPATAESIARQLNAPLRNIPDTWELDLKVGHRIGAAEYLFSMIDMKKEGEWQQKYGGDKKVEEALKQEEKKKKADKKAKRKEAAKKGGDGGAAAAAGPSNVVAN